MHTLDCRELPCPQPVMRCRTELAQNPLLSLRVLVDNDVAVENVRRFLMQRGFSLQCQPQEGYFVLTAERESIENSALPLVQREDEEKILVFITTETLGRGDEELGQKLMTTFLATLPEMGKALWRVILLNGGVKLAATQSPALASLQALEKSGVSVLVCGTCLAHYGLTEQKNVGDTSNMLDIVTSLQLAHKVIRP